ncbi:MAG TPA: RsmB/NOP family class I SAM-dependent RNA methyltransferase [Ignavibacteriales bacterium]|nr:RsmB/NOP family class I SAM-dependent RNA methyltransferase [Ignavibacteriales bacterium]
MIELSQNITDYIASLYGSEIAQKYFDFIKTGHTTYIRLNDPYPSAEALLKKLNGYGVRLEKVHAIPDAYKILSGVEILGKTLEYNLGKYYIQSLSSMIPPLMLSPKGSQTVLDLCSAPGSKATQIASLMGNTGTFITNEPQTDRIKMLVHNIDKLNIVNAGVIQYKGEWLSRLYDHHFDKILVDAPCSALGVLQKKEEVSKWWSKERVEKIAYLQNMILAAAVKMAKEGGEIVYSTCTITPEENELIINHALNKYPLEVIDIELPIKANEGFTSYNGVKLRSELSKARRILPWEVDSEGFFIIKMRKTGRTEPAKPLEVKNNLSLLSYRDKPMKGYLKDISLDFAIDENVWKDYRYLISKNDIYFIHKDWQDHNLSFFNRIGTRFGLIDKNNRAHLHSYAAQYFHKYIGKNIFEITDGSQLKDYLNGGIIRADVQSKDQQVVKCGPYVLGTAAVVNNGIKSQYPKALRIHEISYY